METATASVLEAGSGPPRARQLRPGPLLAPAHGSATRTGLNISAFRYFWNLSGRSQPRLLGRSGEKASWRKCPAILQPVLLSGDLKASLRDCRVAIILHVAYGQHSMPPAVRHGRGSRPHAPPRAARRGLAGRECPRRDLLAGASPSLPFPRHRHLPPPQALSRSNISPHKANPM